MTTLSKDEFLGRVSARQRSSKKAVFVCFRFQDQDSRKFRDQLVAALEPDTAKVLHGEGILDGDWAKQIRARLKRSKFVIADVTGPSREIMFEIGFVGNKRTVLCAVDAPAREALPMWLTGSTVNTYGGPEVGPLIEAITTMIKQQRNPWNQPRPEPTVGSAVWLQSRDSAWCEEHFTRVRNLAQENRVRIERVYPESLRNFDDTREYLNANYVFACLDGGSQDYASHFFVGDVASRPTAGRSQDLQRRAILLRRDFPPDWRWVADSVRRLPRSTASIPHDRDEFEVIAATTFAEYKHYAAGP